MKLKERVAVITGAGSGIGRAAAKEFAREGAGVMVADINFEGARKTVEQIRFLGFRTRSAQQTPASLSLVVWNKGGAFIVARLHVPLCETSLEL